MMRLRAGVSKYVTVTMCRSATVTAPRAAGNLLQGGGEQPLENSAGAILTDCRNRPFRLWRDTPACLYARRQIQARRRKAT